MTRGESVRNSRTEKARRLSHLPASRGFCTLDTLRGARTFRPDEENQVLTFSASINGTIGCIRGLAQTPDLWGLRFPEKRVARTAVFAVRGSSLAIILTVSGVAQTPRWLRCVRFRVPAEFFTRLPSPSYVVVVEPAVLRSPAPFQV
jgi:hypothetical protein